MEQRRRRNNKKKIDPNIAVYLDELDISEEEYYEELEKEIKREEHEQKRAQRNRASREREQAYERPKQNRKKRQVIIEEDYEDSDEIEYIYKKKKKNAVKASKSKKKKKKKHPLRSFFMYLLVFLLIIQIPMFYGIFASFRFDRFSTRSDVSNTKGILLLGVDNEGDINSAHTDSITYLGANFKTKQAVALPIYRDANINQRCTGTPDNINRIYGSKGIECLVESTSDFLGLPVDYYIIVTINGLIDIINGLGTVQITPTGTYCSDYGEDGVNYCFTEGVTEEMTGPQALAYIRYRGGHSGENRANRQMELILAIKNKCMNNLLLCYAKATPKLPGGAKTNIPVTEVFQVMQIFSGGFQFDTLEVLQGTNTTNEYGWTQYVSEYDLSNKTAIIRQRIFQ